MPFEGAGLPGLAASHLLVTEAIGVEETTGVPVLGNALPDKEDGSVFNAEGVAVRGVDVVAKPCLEQSAGPEEEDRDRDVGVVATLGFAGITTLAVRGKARVGVKQAAGFAVRGAERLRDGEISESRVRGSEGLVERNIAGLHPSENKGAPARAIVVFVVRGTPEEREEVEAFKNVGALHGANANESGFTNVS
ncbi:hypothetical protein EPH_0000740 [Eimeria praecox]|uniref:Uncharacterized protein n=1 Tax=Eimeria praecox TaxID=51316 RepID=U6G0L8_9EIME|nr:hypothetical protein EPH_0000740 [Eimeria praecox]